MPKTPRTSPPRAVRSTGGVAVRRARRRVLRRTRLAISLLVAGSLAAATLALAT